MVFISETLTSKNSDFLETVLKIILKANFIKTLFGCNLLRKKLNEMFAKSVLFGKNTNLLD